MTAEYLRQMFADQPDAVDPEAHFLIYLLGAIVERVGSARAMCMWHLCGALREARQVR